MSIQLCGEDGLINGEFPCSNIDVLSFMGKSEIGGYNTNDIWGWTDELTGKEYAIVGKTSGTAFVDISEPTEPIYLGDLPSNTSYSVWRDIKVCDNYAYIGSEADEHGMQIFDLRKLRGLTFRVVHEHDSIRLGNFSKSHNIVMSEDTKIVAGVGGETFGLNMVDISNPLSPNPIGVFSDGYIHDAQIVIYNGPDIRYQGKEIAIGCNERWVSIMDITDKNNCYVISTTSHNNVKYTHQGWLTEDHRYFLVNDEKDESERVVDKTATYIFNVEDLEKPFLFHTHLGTNLTVDHNLYIRDTLVYQSNYTSGLRILDISNIDDRIIEEVAFLDCMVTTAYDLVTLGTWSNYCYFNSGTVVFTDIKTGLWIVKPRYLDVTYTQVHEGNIQPILEIEVTCLTKIKYITVEGLSEEIVINYNISNKTSTVILSNLPETSVGYSININIKVNNLYNYTTELYIIPPQTRTPTPTITPTITMTPTITPTITPTDQTPTPTPTPSTTQGILTYDSWRFDRCVGSGLAYLRISQPISVGNAVVVDGNCYCAKYIVNAVVGAVYDGTIYENSEECLQNN